MMGPVAIIGAGVAGLSTAAALRQAGFQVFVFEKSRGLGGRMATRRRNDFTFDHGAQSFTAQSHVFAEIIRQWQASGAAAVWYDDQFVGQPDMTAPAHLLATGIDVRRETRVFELSKGQSGWRLKGEDGYISAPGVDTFAAVILAIPAPQVTDLARTAGVSLEEVNAVSYQPCLAAMAAFENRLGSMPDRLEPDHAIVRWVARNASKPGRTDRGDTFVIHATPTWSERHLDEEHEHIGKKLLESFYELCGERPEPLELMGHRWRYAFVERPLGGPFLWRGDIGLGACGDWCLGASIECAATSGLAMAEHLIAQREQ